MGNAHPTYRMNLLATNLLTHLVDLVFGGSAPTGEGRDASLDWSAPWATWVTLLVLIVAAVYVVFIYAQEQTGRPWAWRVLLAGLRFSLIALALFMIYRLVLRPYKTDLPDLVIVDGGKGQLGSAMKELQRLALEELPVVGLAKEREEIFRPGDLFCGYPWCE